MKKHLLTYALFLTFSGISAQIIEPIHWTFNQKSPTELTFHADIDAGWHLYGTEIPEDGPVATKIVFETLENAELAGSISASKTPIEKYDNNFLMTLSYFENAVDFTQKIKLKDPNNYRISGYVEFMACNDEMCIAPKKEPFEFAQKSEVSKNPPFVDKTQDTRAKTQDTRQQAQDTVPEIANRKSQIANQEIDLWQPISGDFNSTDTADTSLWWIFAMGLLGGLLALLTPCVWPIIPMTVSFFLKRNNDKRRGRRDAVLYALAIIIIYVGLGLIITAVFGASALNDLSTNAIFNIFLFLLLIIFALSFFGAFEITLPASWANCMDKRAESTAGFVSILFMAFTLALVSFSCTGLIIGLLLVEVGSTGSLLAPAVGMTGFALSLAIPFGFFAFFPAMLNSLPRSGGWLNEVKVSLAFFELAFALKFLSVADMSYGWGILPRPLFIALWVIIPIAFALYMLGIIRFPHDTKKRKLNWIRISLALAAFLFAGYMASGFFGKPLKTVSAFLPPVKNEQVFHDYDEGMRYAAEHKMPAFIDFTGYGCVNCRKMEAAVFTVKEVETLMSKYVVISLYVDDKKALNAPYEVTENGKTITLKTIGDKWSYLQRRKFRANAQPYYVLLDNSGNLLAPPHSYSEDVGKFLEFLRMGLANYQK
ncbi:MAG: thioredoxin family protein [Prevotellaceae bacterium]|jgi:thiol:disulfide interchange protein DsbD|nr:thioredoxin family protein [Prevotellaceae bacterium]